MTFAEGLLARRDSAVISISMQFQGGGQPPKGTDSPFPKVAFPSTVLSDAAANTWFAAYGYREDWSTAKTSWSCPTPCATTIFCCSRAGTIHPPNFSADQVGL